MTNSPPDSGREPPELHGLLVVVTGASHAGKSTLIEALINEVRRPAAHISIDEAIESVDVEPGKRWEDGLRLAYQGALEEARRLLSEGSIVLFESTFTYVPPDHRAPEFHGPEIQRLRAMSREVGAQMWVVRLAPSLSDVATRRENTGRLSETIVKGTWQLHAERSPPHDPTLTIDSSRRTTAEMVAILREEIPELFRSAS